MWRTFVLGAMVGFTLKSAEKGVVRTLNYAWRLLLRVEKPSDLPRVAEAQAAGQMMSNE